MSCLNSRKEFTLLLILGLAVVLNASGVSGQSCGDGVCEEGESPGGCPDDCLNLVKNPGFEDGFQDWSHSHTGGVGDGTEKIVSENCFEGGRCLELHSTGTNWQRNCQYFGRLVPGEIYVFSVMFNTTPEHAGYINLVDSDWKDSSGNEVQESYQTILSGNNDWMEISELVSVPLVDDYGESTANHEWRVCLHGHRPEGNYDPVYYDDVQLSLNMFLLPYGCVNDDNSKCIDFGSDDEGAGGIQYTKSAMTGKLSEGDITFRSIKPKNITYIEIPAFNVDQDGFPLSPMLLEIRFKDTINDSEYAGSNPNRLSKHRAFVYSKIDFTSPEPYTRAWLKYYDISSLGEFGDNRWRYTQYPFQKTPFQLIRAIDSKFKIRILMPNRATEDGSLYLPIDYVSLRKITQQECLELTERQRRLRDFVEVTMPVDEPSPPLVYANPDITVFVRDIMRPVYGHTKPASDEINRDIVSFSAPGEVEALSFSIYSSNGIDNLEFEISDLENPLHHQAIKKENISIFRVVHDKKRLLPYSLYLQIDIENYYSLIPDSIEEFSLLDVDADSSERIWLHVHVPEDLPPGLYEGHVDIKRGGILQKRVDIKLEIFLPARLDLPNNTNPVYHDPFFKAYSPDIDEVFRLYRETGFDPFFYIKEIKLMVDSNDKIYDFNTTVFEEKLDRMVDEGFLKDKAILEVTTSSDIYEHVFGERPRESDTNLYYKLSDTEFVEAFGMLITKLIGIGNQRGMHFIFSAVDEPCSNAFKRVKADRLYTVINDSGGETTTTYTTACDDPMTGMLDKGYITPGNVIPPSKDLIDYKIFVGFDQEFGYYRLNNPKYSPYGHYGYYTTLTSYLRNPIYNRFMHGLLAFRTDAEVVSAFAMGDYANDPFDDFDAKADLRYPFTKPDFLFIYPTWENAKLIPTMALEGIREGIKDAKYIATLERLIRENPSSPDAIEAQDYLNSVKNRIHTNFWNGFAKESNQFGFYHLILKNVSETSDPGDFESFTTVRKKIHDFILRLSPTPGCDNDGTCESGETPRGCPHDCLNLVKNPGFEDGFQDWSHSHTGGVGDGTEEIVSENCFEGGRCLELHSTGTNWQRNCQYFGRLVPGEIYVFSVMFNTTPGHSGYISLVDRNWKDSSGNEVQESYQTILSGNNDWMEISELVSVPLVDDFGESTANHEWRVCLHGHQPKDNYDPVYYDTVRLYLGVYCGNRICDPGETTAGCPEDCALCTDGTLLGACSGTKPLYCESGNLVNRCSVCGCPVGLQCQADESCVFACPRCDITGDGKINTLDLSEIGAHLGDTGPGIPADINEDGEVDIFDMVMVGRAISEG